MPHIVIDHDGDALNTGTGTRKLAKDLSIDFVQAPYPDYPPAFINVRPGERQLWRVQTQRTDKALLNPSTGTVVADGKE